MSSVLALLQEIDNLTADESIIQTPYSRTSALELRVWRERLEEAFNKEPQGEETRTIFVKVNSIALGLEWHLSVANEKYREKQKCRQEADILFKSMQTILTDYNLRKEQFTEDEVALAEFAILMNEVYKYYRKSQDFVWDRTVYDDVLVEKIKGFMEDYNHGLYFRNSTDIRSCVCDDAESAECTTDVDGSDSDSNNDEISEEQ